MAFHRLPYDEDSYKQALAESMGPGRYRVLTPFPKTHRCPPVEVTRAETGLLGIGRHLSKASRDKYDPQKADPAGYCARDDPFQDELEAEGTRLSNPPSTLRGTGFHRWGFPLEEPLSDPKPEMAKSDRALAKSRPPPCRAPEVDQSAALPPAAPEERRSSGPYDRSLYKFTPVPMVPDLMPSVPYARQQFHHSLHRM